MICSVYAILSIDYKIECMTGKYSCLCCSIFFDLNKYLLLSAKTQNSIATLSAMPQKALRMIFVNSKPPLSQNKVGSIGPSLASSSIFAPSFSGSSKKVQTRLLVYGHWHHIYAKMCQFTSFRKHGIDYLTKRTESFNDCIEHDNKMLVCIKVLYIVFSFLFTTELEHFILDKLTNQADHTSAVR